jgi:hypothetical protein
MFCVPLGRELLAIVAVPELSMLTVPSPEVPSMKVTVPPEGTPAVDVTNAEKVTCWPDADGLGVPVTVVVVAVFESGSISGVALADNELAEP